MIFEDLLDLSPRLVGNAWPAIDDFGNSGCGYAGDFCELADLELVGGCIVSHRCFPLGYSSFNY